MLKYRARVESFEPPGPGVEGVEGMELSGTGVRFAVLSDCTDSIEALMSGCPSGAPANVRCRGLVMMIRCFNSSSAEMESFLWTMLAS